VVFILSSNYVAIGLKKELAIICCLRLLHFGVSRPTVCVTRAGAGGGTPSDWKNAEA